MNGAAAGAAAATAAAAVDGNFRIAEPIKVSMIPIDILLIGAITLFLVVTKRLYRSLCLSVGLSVSSFSAF